MSIKDDLQAELKAAMKARDRRRLDVIRQIETEVSRHATAPGFKGEIDDDLYQTVIVGYVKKMEKAKREYDQMGERGRDMADKLAFEIEYLERWLPTMRSEEETRRLVDEAIAELGVDDPKQAGRVIGHLMKTYGDLDGATVGRLVRERLQ